MKQRKLEAYKIEHDLDAVRVSSIDELLAVGKVTYKEETLETKR